MENNQFFFLLPNLKFGGAERVSINLARNLKERGFEVYFLLMSLEGEFLKEAKEEFNVLNLSCNRTYKLPFKLIYALWKYRPYAIISSFWKLNLCNCLARLFYPKVKSFLWEHGLPSLNEHNKPKWLFSISASLIYPIANRIIAVSSSVSSDIKAITFGLEHRMSVIFNPIIPPDFEFKKTKEITNIRRLIWVGRLENSKNPELMIDAFLQLSENYFLDFIGDGALKLKLENKCKKHGLEKRINFRGFQSDVYEWMINADILVVTSDHEGLPSVIVEALYCGLRIVSTDCRGGIRDILCNEKYGKLVPIRDPNALAIAIENSYNISYSIDFQKKGGERFLPKVITDQFLNEILA